MKEENIDKRLEEGIRAFSAKKIQLEHWNQEESIQTRRSQRLKVYGIGAAASIAVIVGVGLSYSISHGAEDNQLPATNNSSQYSSLSAKPLTGDEEIKTLLEMKEYEVALDAVLQRIKETQTNDTVTVGEQEKRLYTLKWMEIQILLGLERNSEAIQLLTEYVDKKGEHREEARNQLEKIKK